MPPQGEPIIRSHLRRHSHSGMMIVQSRLTRRRKRIMKNMSRYLLAGLVLLLMLPGCAKKPTQEIDAAKSAVDGALAAGAEIYAPEDVRRLNASLNSALGEVKSQEGKLFKNYKNANSMLAKVKADADTVKAGLAAKKEEARKQALAAQEKARAGVEGVKSQLSKAPKGKKAGADIEAATKSVQGLEDALADVQKMIDAEEYPSALHKAGAIENEATALSGQLRLSMGKKPAHILKKRHGRRG
jgi:hypothetical protein